ncbi:MAG: hypothetical protein II886_07515 [Prevotella sp.]|nr:hypothetical protein [Prevotella sp.]
MAEQKSKYLIWLETLHREYTERTNITLFGQQAMHIKLLADMYEVRCRFEKILERLQQGAIVLEDDDVDYEEWYNPEKWKITGNELVDEDITETLGIGNKNAMAQSYANALLTPFGENAKFDNDKFRNIVSSLYVLNLVVDNQRIDVAINEELATLQKTLLDISNAKTRELTDDECASFFVDMRDKYLNGFLVNGKLVAEHRKWKEKLLNEIDIDELKERRIELLLGLFDTGFLDDMTLHRRATDPLGFDNYEFEKWEGKMNEAKKCFAKLCRICPYQGEMIDFSNHATIGRYIIKAHIGPAIVNGFLEQMQLIAMVQRDMRRILNNEVDVCDAGDSPVDAFVNCVKHIMLKAEEENGTVKPLTARGNGGIYTYNVNGKAFVGVMDTLVEKYEDRIKAYLDGLTAQKAKTIKYVAPFIGAVLETHLFSPANMPKKDIEPAFESEYGRGTSAVSKMAKSNLSETGNTLVETLKSIANKS